MRILRLKEVKGRIAVTELKETGFEASSTCVEHPRATVPQRLTMFISINCVSGILLVLSLILTPVLETEITVCIFFFFFDEKTESRKTSKIRRRVHLNTDFLKSKSLALKLRVFPPSLLPIQFDF